MDTYAEQFIKDYTNHCSNELCAVEDKFGKKVISYREWLTPNQALRAVEIAREELVDKACSWLRDYQEYPAHDIDTDKLIKAFKEYVGS